MCSGGYGLSWYDVAPKRTRVDLVEQRTAYARAVERNQQRFDVVDRELQEMDRLEEAKRVADAKLADLETEGASMPDLSEAALTEAMAKLQREHPGERVRAKATHILLCVHGWNPDTCPDCAREKGGAL